jgi:hypothetical protein
MTSTSYFRKQSEGHFSVMGRQRASWSFKYKTCVEFSKGIPSYWQCGRKAVPTLTNYIISY